MSCIALFILSLDTTYSLTSSLWAFWVFVIISNVVNMFIPATFFTNKGISIRGNFTPWQKIKSYKYFDWNEIEFVWAKPTLFGNKSFRLRPYPHDLVSGEQINAILSKHLPRTEVSELEATQQPL